MPLFRPVRAAFRLPRRHYALAPPGGRLFGLALVALGLGFLAMTAAPLGLAGAQPGPGAAAPAAPASGTTFACTAPCDPGVRGGPAGAGGPLPGLSSAESRFFAQARTTFQELDSVRGTLPGEPSAGLGPRFNMNSCSGCHAFPDVGGSSPSVNPQVAVATLDGASNRVPFFITANGPVREARFKSDGGVHDLYTITGRVDAPGCSLGQPDFGAAARAGNLIFRIPTPTFGAGVIASIEDQTIINNKNAQSQVKAALTISGHENRSGNDGTITRFGWKAQNKSLEMFAGEAYNVEQGVTNDVFPNEREENAGCYFNGTPEDHIALDTGAPSDVAQFAAFMRLLAPPTPAPATATTQTGAALFNAIGCGLCHTPSLQTGPSSNKALGSIKAANLYSDLLVHNMGVNLADGISQGNAAGDEFKTAPLWGLGQRIFLLHDGRTSDLLDAILEHQSQGSEANTVISNFRLLSTGQKQAILVFLRSL